MSATSILDRILAINIDSSTENERVFYEEVDSVSKLERVIRRDIEYLLNSKCFKSFSKSEEIYNYSQSFLNYGLPDFTGLNPKTPAVQQLLKNEIQKKIKLFEPRLTEVTVIYDDNQELLYDDYQKKWQLSFYIYAKIKNESFTFKTYFDAFNMRYKVEQ